MQARGIERQASLLTLEKVEVHYGGIRAVKGIDLTVEQGELVCLIGANGAGKTTTLRAITGLARAAGRIVYGAPRRSCRRLRDEVCVSGRTGPVTPRALGIDDRRGR